MRRANALRDLVRQPDFVRHLEPGRFDEPFLFHPMHRREAALPVQVITFADGRRIIIARETEALSAGRHRIEAEIGSACVVEGRAKALHSAFANVASNAVRYAPEGGLIVLSWRIRDDGVGEFCVWDTGIGVAAVHVDRLTGRFHRIDRSRSRETGGTGLGLAIVKHVLTRHQGELRVRSTLGKGSEYFVLLPAQRVIRSDPAS